MASSFSAPILWARSSPPRLSHTPSASLPVSTHSLFFDGQHCIVLCPPRLPIPARGRSISLSAVAVMVTVCSFIGRINAPSARLSSLYAADSWNCSCIRFKFSAWRKPFPLAASHQRCPQKTSAPVDRLGISTAPGRLVFRGPAQGIISAT
jgi:hypothetical protein